MDMFSTILIAVLIKVTHSQNYMSYKCVLYTCLQSYIIGQSFQQIEKV